MGGGGSLFFGDTGFKGTIPPTPNQSGYPFNTGEYSGPNPMGRFPLQPPAGYGNVAPGSYGGGYGIGGMTGGPGNFGMQNYGGFGSFQPNFYTPFQTPYTRSMPMQGTTGVDLDQTNRDYANTFNAYRGMGGSEEEFIGSDQFKDFENTLIDQIGSLSDEDRLRSDLDAQTARAGESSIYAPSAGRIAGALQRRLNRLQQAPRRQETYGGVPSFRSQFGGFSSPMMNYGLGGIPSPYSGIPSRFGSSMFGYVPNYYTRDYAMPGGLYSTTPGAYRYTRRDPSVDATGVAPSGVDGAFVDQDIPSPQDINEKSQGGNFAGVPGLIQNADGSYTYTMPGTIFEDLGMGSNTVNLPANFDITQLGASQADIDNANSNTVTTDTTTTETTAASSDPANLQLYGADNEGLTARYTQEMEAFTKDGTRTEEDFVNSPRFMEFENALTRSYLSKNLTDIEKEAKRQRERADAGGIYAASAGRIADSLEAYANTL